MQRHLRTHDVAEWARAFLAELGAVERPSDGTAETPSDTTEADGLPDTAAEGPGSATERASADV